MRNLGRTRWGIRRSHAPSRLLQISLALALLSQCLAGAIIALTVSATPAAAAEDTLASAPPNNNAFIFNTFEGYGNQVAADNEVASLLDMDSEGYKVTRYQDTATTPGTALIQTLATDAKNAGVLIINAHAGPTGLGLQVYSPCLYVTPNGPSACDDVNPSNRGEEDPGYARADDEAKQINKSYGPKSAYVSLEQYLEVRTFVWRWVTSLSAKGIAHVFDSDGAKQGIVDINGCQSMSLDTSFNAEAYFGNGTGACSGSSEKSEESLFQDLAGQKGLEHRSTKR